MYGKDKEAKVLKNLKIGQANAKRKFLEKYPDADISKFKFEVKLTEEGDIDSYKIKIYVTDDKWFVSDLSPYTITNTLSPDYMKNPFLASLLAAYVTTYVCRISVKHFEYNNHTPGIITSMARYHLYYHMSRFLRNPGDLERYMKYIILSVRKHTPYIEIWEDAFYKTNMTLSEWYEWAKSRDPRGKVVFDTKS